MSRSLLLLSEISDWKQTRERARNAEWETVKRERINDPKHACWAFNVSTSHGLFVLEHFIRLVTLLSRFMTLLAIVTDSYNRRQRDLIQLCIYTYLDLHQWRYHSSAAACLFSTLFTLWAVHSPSTSCCAHDTKEHSLAVVGRLTLLCLCWFYYLKWVESENCMISPWEISELNSNYIKDLMGLYPVQIKYIGPSWRILWEGWLWCRRVESLRIPPTYHTRHIALCVWRWESGKSSMGRKCWVICFAIAFCYCPHSKLNNDEDKGAVNE